MSPGTPEPASAAGTRSRIYWLLADLLRAGPDPELLARLQASPGEDPDTAGDVDCVASAVARLRGSLAGEAPKAIAERLAPEHARLFGGIRRGYGPPPPFESVYREGASAPEVTLDVVRAYRAAGFGPIDETAGPQDHVSVELRFMALACLRESEAWARGSAREALAWRDRQRAFLDEHLLAWLPALCAAVRTAAREPYFRHLVDLTEAVCRADRDALEHDPAGGEPPAGVEESCP